MTLQKFIINDDVIYSEFETSKNNTSDKVLGLYDLLPLKKYKNTTMDIQSIIQTDISYMIWVLENTNLKFDDDVINAVNNNNQYQRKTSMY